MDGGSKSKGNEKEERADGRFIGGFHGVADISIACGDVESEHESPKDHKGGIEGEVRKLA